MKRVILQFPFTAVAAVFAAAVVGTALVGHVNVIEVAAHALDGIAPHEVDDIAAAALLVALAFVIDHVLAVRRTQHEIIGLQAERLRVVQVTMRTVQDVVNNCLNQLQLVRFEAEGHVPEESLMLFDESIRSTVEKLKSLGAADVYSETQMAIGTGLGVAARVH